MGLLGLEPARGVVHGAPAPELRRTAPRVGNALVTDRRRPLLTLIKDTSSGVHDTLVAAYDMHRYAGLGQEGHNDICTDNLRLALLAIGLAPAEIPCTMNLWKNTPSDGHGDGHWLPPVSRPGDRMVLRAEMDTVVVVSACFVDLLPINGEAAMIRPLHLKRLD